MEAIESMMVFGGVCKSVMGIESVGVCRVVVEVLRRIRIYGLVW